MVRMYRSRSVSVVEKRRYPERDLAGSIRPSASRNRILDVLMSGNSGRSWASTSPMPNWPAVSGIVLGTSAAAVRGRRPRVRADVLTGQEQEPELADLHLVPPGQLGLLDPLPVHVRAVEAAHIADGEPGAVPVELGMTAGDGHVVEEDIAVRVAARGGQVAVEAEPAARVGTAHHQEQRAARRQRAERRGIREEIFAEIVLGPAQRDRRGGLARALAGRVAARPAGGSREPRPGRHPGSGRYRRGQLGPAVRAEPSPVGIRPAAPGAVDAWHGSARPPLVLIIVFERPSPRYARRGGAVHAPREQPAPSASAIFAATLPPHRRITSAVHPRRALLPCRARRRARPGIPATAGRIAMCDSLTFAKTAWVSAFRSREDTAYLAEP